MAERDDKSLDDFFAKRDKKKKKDKTKVTKGAAAVGPGGPAKAAVSPDAPAPAPAPSPDTPAPAPPLTPVTAPAEAAPATAPAAAASKKGRKEKERAAKSECQDPQQEREDEEWKEFEQKEVDYSGLRIHALQISDEREEEDDEKKDDQGEDGENVLYRDGDELAGPWNKMTQIPAPAVMVAEVPESKPSGVYRPPAARSGNVRRTQSQGPPEIFNDAQFPSLQASAKHIETRKDKEMEKTFEMVKYKNRAREDGSKSQSVQLELGNQFAVLGEQ
ncbi:protein CDV3 homolog isoform X1 [Hemiscyllium ocellatum]|uniref:protein CDV3 homolog isoform X1 n=1 Tax=Hemiscyllium ocellatum TaxID=170820 RepID=UPI002966E366|nr:protein CDV3 homolog isoform X1 [Hemiscyllium ocellatum]